MAKVPQMAVAERRELIRLGQLSGDPRTALRFLAVARLGAGRSTVQVARELEVARSTVVAAARRYCESGTAGLYDRRCHNGERKADEAFHQRVADLLMASPEDFGWRRPTWTRELLCLQMVNDGWPEVAVCTMGRVLAHIGARLGCPRPVVLCPWARETRLRRLAKLRRLEANASAVEPVLYADEVDINLNPKIGREWMLMGQQRRVITPGKNEKFYIAGALDVRTGKLHTVGGSSKNSGLFCELLGHLVDGYPRAKKIHLIVDNYSVHTSKLTKTVLEAYKGRVVLHFLPPYCADANRIERVWQDLHANVTRNHRCATMDELLANAWDYLDAYRWRQATGAAAWGNAA